MNAKAFGKKTAYVPSRERLKSSCFILGVLYLCFFLFCHFFVIEFAYPEFFEENGGLYTL
jgi:hypothetical protein